MKGLAPKTKSLIIGSMLIQVCPAAFFVLFNLYLKENHFSSQNIGVLNAYRYLVIFLFSLPLGLFASKTLTQILLKLSAMLMPFSGALTLIAVARGSYVLASIGMLLMGLSMLIQQAFLVPFLLEGETKHSSSSTLAWHFALASCSTLIVGGVSLLLELIPNFVSHADDVLWGSVGVSLLGSWYFRRLRKPMTQVAMQGFTLPNGGVWRRIFNLLIPQFFICAGAGLSIPYLNLFFHEKWGLGHRSFMTLTFFSTLAVILASLAAPKLARFTDDRTVCTRSQYLSVVCLLGLGFCTGSLGLALAMVLFFIRQPLMNMGSPILTKFTMEYVGEDNRQLLGALSQMTWGFGWFLSSILYGYMRNQGLIWLEIFFLTGVAYLIGGFWYAELMRSNQPEVVESIN